MGIESADFALSSMETQGGLLASFSDLLYNDLSLLGHYSGSKTVLRLDSYSEFMQNYNEYITQTWDLDNRARSSENAKPDGHRGVLLGAWRGFAKSP